jgi:succinoglycan biosynthesis transport protein ExoP
VTRAGAPLLPAPGGDPTLGGLVPMGSRSLEGGPAEQGHQGLSPLAGESREGGIQNLLRTIKRRQTLFLFTSALVSGALAVNTIRERIFSPVYQGSFQLQISSPFDEGGSPVAGDGGKLEAIARYKQRIDVPSLIVLLRSPYLTSPVATRLGLSNEEIAKNLVMDTVPGVQNVITVDLRWPDPTKGKAILAALAHDYVAFSLSQRQATLDSGVKYLDQQAPAILREVATLENQLSRFREANKMVDPIAMVSTIESRRNSLANDWQNLQVDQAQLESQLNSVESGHLSFTPSGAPSAISQLGNNGALIPGRQEKTGGNVNNVKTPSDQLNEFEMQLAQARATYKEDSPIVQSILARKNALLPVVESQKADSIRAKLFANKSQQDEVNRQIMLYNRNFKNSPKILREYEKIMTKLSNARDNYTSYLKARENFRLERSRFITPWQVISPPNFGDTPVQPDIKKSLLQAILLGLISGIGAALLREKTDNVFHTPMEAEKELQLPVLGLIPYLPLEPGVDISTSISKMSASERFAIKESLRSLFTTFRLLRADHNIRLVGVTSSTQGEGKSTSVSIFARTLSDLGLKVLVVDADMRLPMQARYLGIASGEGFSSVLSDSSIPISSLIISLQENLDVLPAGPKPPDPAKLLNSTRCSEVINELRAMSDYDIILFDAPPCLMLSDPILLGEKLDGILFLVGLGKVNRNLAPQAARRIKATGVDLLGIICNQVNFPSRLNDYGYEYGYYYHYAYAYTDSYGKQSTKTNGISNYIKRYRDSYMTKSADPNSDRYTNSGIGRYIDAGVDGSEGNKAKSKPEKPTNYNLPTSTRIKKPSNQNNWISKIFRRNKND